MYNDYNNNNEKTSDMSRRAMKYKSNDRFVLVWTLTAIGISVFISMAIVFALNADWIPSAIKHKIDNFISGIHKSSGIPMLGGKQNILILGVDSNGLHTDPFKGTRSDTIIVLSIDPFTKTANAVSIPRDSKVFIANDHGLDKINSAHAIGGPDLTVRTVEETFGMKINHYIVIDRNGVKDLVEALNGVPVYVEKRMHYTDRSAHLYIDLYPGMHNLSPQEAEEYLRFRHDALGDIGRIKRQQNFIRGLAKKMQSPEMIMKIPQVIQVASKYIRSDMNFYELSQLAAYAKSINLDEVQTATLPGKPSRFGSISYWILDTEKSQSIIDRLIYRDGLYKKYSGLTVSIMYAGEYVSKLEEIETKLKESGYSIACKARTREPHSQVIAHSSYATLENARALKRSIPELKSAQINIVPDNYPCAESDFTIVFSDTDINN